MPAKEKAIQLYKDWVISHWSCWPLTHPERSSEWRLGGDTLCTGKTGRTGLQIVWYFSGECFMNTNSCLFPYLEKLRALFPHDFMTMTSNKLLPGCVLGCPYSLNQTLIHIDLPCLPPRTVLQNSLRGCLPSYSPQKDWKWKPTPVFLPGNSMDGGAQRAIVHGVAKS